MLLLFFILLNIRISYHCVQFSPINHGHRILNCHVEELSCLEELHEISVCEGEWWIEAIWKKMTSINF